MGICLTPSVRLRGWRGAPTVIKARLTGAKNDQTKKEEVKLMALGMPAPVPARRRIGSSDTTVIYDGGICMAIGEIIGGIKATYALTTKAIETRDAVLLNDVKITMSNQLLELYTAAFALLETNTEQSARCRELEEKIVQLEQKADEKARYELVEPYPGTFVYGLKAEYVVSDPPHHICPTCMDNRSMKSIIQFPYGKKIVGTCNECSKTYRFADDVPLDISSFGRGGPNSWMGS